MGLRGRSGAILQLYVSDKNGRLKSRASGEQGLFGAISTRLRGQRARQSPVNATRARKRAFGGRFRLEWKGPRQAGFLAGQERLGKTPKCFSDLSNNENKIMKVPL